MAILDFIMGLFNKEEEQSEKSVQKLKALPPDERDDEIVAFLYQCCFDNAAKFVHEEMHRSGSHFKQLSRDHFFREMLMMNFWMVDKVFKKQKPELAVKLFQHYFGRSPGGACNPEELEKRIKSYYNYWDDYSGHQDLFGQKAAAFLFGAENEGSGYSVPEVSFWIISYADEAVKSLKKIRNAYRQAELI